MADTWFPLTAAYCKGSAVQETTAGGVGTVSCMLSSLRDGTVS